MYASFVQIPLQSFYGPIKRLSKRLPEELVQRRPFEAFHEPVRLLTGTEISSEEITTMEVA